MRGRGRVYRSGWQPGSGFGRGQGSVYRGWRPQPKPEERPPSPPLGPLVTHIKLPDLAKNDENAGDPKVSDCSFVASFNWMDSTKPTIVVPGMPPAWKPLSEPAQLKEDSGQYFRDPNAARYPKHPIEPAVRAILAQDPAFSAQEIDVFACGSTLCNLLRVVRNKDPSFRFIVEVIGNTTFFVRRENSPDEKIQGIYGYGHTFPERYTQWQKDVVGSASHQRLVAFTFGGLRYIIRSECDGYIEDKVKYEVDEQEFQLPSDLDGLKMQKGGKRIPQEAIFDLKTRSAKKKDEDVLGEEIHRLWARQTSSFVLAFHERGVFNDIRVQDVRSQVQKWEKEHEDELRQLSILVKKVISCARTTPDGRCEVRCRGQGVLELRYVGGEAPHALPEQLGKIWAGTEAGDSTSDEDAEAGGAYVVLRDGYDEEDDAPSWSSDEDSEKDYTACSAEECGYCGRCKY